MDGVLDAELDIGHGSALGTRSSFLVGSLVGRENGEEGTSYSFLGLLDELMVFEKNLSAEQIQGLYRAMK